MRSLTSRPNIVLAVLASVAILLAAGGATAATASKIGWQFGYDERGRTTSITDPAGKRTRIRYTDDANGRPRTVTRELPGGGKVTHVFDKRGRRERMIDGAGSVRFTYDRSDRLTAVRRDGAPAIAYRYDTLGRVRSVAIGGDFTVGYRYDFRGRLEKITTPAGSILYRYSGESGSVARKLPNGITTRWVYRPDGGLGSITHTSQANKPLGRFQYSYRLDGLITTIEELTPGGVRHRQFSYDSARRLVSVSGRYQPRIDYAYDKFGNLTQRRRDGAKQTTSRYDWAGRLVRHDGRPCRHDPAGNLTSCDGGTARFTFNDTALLATASPPGGATIHYRYDGDGNLLRRSSGSVQQSFLPDPFADIWRPLLVTGPGGRRTYYIWEGETPLMAVSGGEARYFLHDNLGSVRLVADRRGAVVERRDYTPFGAPLGRRAHTGLRPGFAGLFHDAGAGLILTRARAYDPTRARFLQPDPQHRVPMGSQKDLSAYAYCGGDPVNFVDLNGAAPRWANFTYWATGAKLLFDPTGTLFDPTSAKKWYAAASERSIRQASGTGIAAGLKAGFYDLAGGYIPGKHYSRGQELASVAWSLAGGVGSPVSIGYRQITHARAIGGIGIVRNIASPFVKISEGDTRGAVKDVVLFGWGKANKFASAKSFGLLTSKINRMPMGRTLKSVSDWSEITRQSVSYRRKSIDIIKANSRPTFSHSSRSRGLAGGGWGGPGGPGQFSSFNPTKVGGIRLAGAGGALSHLGALEGIALDEANGGLVLVAKGKRPVALPPLRLDDVVTVFRSVYQHGAAPSVSIDPISNKKTERLMTVRHGPGTANTYVGWVLYEADRIMKSYHLGKDNKTRKGVRRLPGYRDFHKYTNASYRQVWERFWIVPASLSRTRSKTAGLTLFDVPLKLSAERMAWSGGGLVTAPNSQPTASGRAFRDWFTQSYDRIAAAVMATPPAACGVGRRVPVFQELRRIALITAIAESLRDQGVPMPAWMRGYRVRPCPVDQTTPILRVTKDRVKLTGGVRLAAADATIRDLAGGAAQEGLARAVIDEIAARPLLSPVSLNHGGARYRAVALPGARSEALGANMIDHTDVALPISADLDFGLTRRFNSFFAPDGVFGPGWTLDLPRLERQLRPVSRDGRTTRFQAAYELTSPLSSWSARFAEIRSVPEVNGRLMVPTREGAFLGLADSSVAVLGQSTKLLVLRDGRRWHFDEHGYLVARTNRSMSVIYRRDTLHRIHFIKVWKASHGGLEEIARTGVKPDAEFQLDYLGMRVQVVEAFTATRKTTVKARYFYNESGTLAIVVSTVGTTTYSYQGGLVAGVAVNGKTVATYTYAEGGRLRTESGADGKVVAYQSVATSSGTKMIARAAASGALMESIEYDASLRPLRRAFGDGSNVAWRETPDHIETVLTEADGEKFTILETKNGRRSTLNTPTGETHVADFDEAGRLTRMKFDGGPIVNQQWHADGRMKSIVSDTQAVLPAYDRDGMLRSVILTTPAQATQSRLSQYVKVSYDQAGRISSYEDSSGAQVQATYARSGGPSVIWSKRAKMTIDYDPKGRATRIDTSWGRSESYSYDASSGDLKQIVLRQMAQGGGEEMETVSFEDGRITAIRQSDGGATAIGYYREGSAKDFVRSVRTPNDVRLSYDYDGRKRLDTITVGHGNRPMVRIRYRYDSRGRLTGLVYEPPAQ